MRDDALLEQATLLIREHYLSTSERYRHEGKPIVADFLRLIAERGHRITTCIGIRRDLGIKTATFHSAIMRGTGHGTRVWLDRYRLAIVGQMRAKSSLSQAQIGVLMGASSPQSFGRWLQRARARVANA